MSCVDVLVEKRITYFMYHLKVVLCMLSVSYQEREGRVDVSLTPSF